MNEPPRNQVERPTPERLCAWLEADLAGPLGAIWPGFALSPRSQATDVADGTTVLLLRDASRHPRAIVLCSAPAAPDMVLRGTSRARLARQVLGPTLGAVILEVLAEGRVRGLSYAVYPFCQALSGSRAIWAVQRHLLREPMLGWLRAATARTAVAVEPAQIEPAFAAPLRHLASLAPLGGRLRRAAGEAAARLGAGAWAPRHVLEHGDLWKGNILVRRAHDASPPARWRDRLVVIDWPGSEVRGHAMFDLARLALSLGVGPRRLRAEVGHHCVSLGCGTADAASHLLAALGHLALNLEHFPLDRFVRTAEACYSALDRATE